MTRPIHFLRPDERAVELLPWTDYDLDQMAQVDPTDRRKADAYWRRFLPKRLRDILSARSVASDDAVQILPF